MSRRVVITGQSAITPIGYGQSQIEDNLRQRKSGIRPMKGDDLLSQHIHSKVYGTVEAEIAYDFTRQFRKTMGPVSFYACQVAKDAIEDAGLDQNFLSSGRMGVAFSSTHGSPSVQRSIYETFFSGSSTRMSRISAADYLKSMVHTTAVNITKMFGITGRVIASSTACTTSSQSIGFGFESVKYGMQDAMLCGGADEYDTTTVAVFDNLMACSTAYNDQASKTPRPFDQDRDGLVVGEGAGALILEEYEHARARSANIIAEVVGFACTNNGGDLIIPAVDGVARTIQEGLRNAQIGAEQIDLVCAHATATRMGDVVEAQAICRVLGDHPWVTALKSYLGHTMGSCGVIETILALYMMQSNQIFPILNLDRVDERCRGIRHCRSLVSQPLEYIAVENFAFGGVNTFLIIKKIS